MKVILDIDPLLIASLDRLGAESKRARTKLIRDAIYSYVWNVYREGGAHVRIAPGYSTLLEHELLRVVRDTDGRNKLQPVDEQGLVK